MTFGLTRGNNTGQPNRSPIRFAKVHLPCVHLGNPTGQFVRCPNCKGRVAVKVFTCALFGLCARTDLESHSDIRFCHPKCLGYEPDGDSPRLT
jgi:hypothetical protein